MNVTQKIVEHKWLVIILILATTLRFYHLDFQSLWMDEIYTMNVSNPAQTWLEMHKHIIKREGFPHFYFALLRIFYFVFGYTSFVARMVSVLAGIGCVYVIYLIGKLLIHKNVGLITALLLSVNEYQIYISQDARPYSLYFLATVFSFYRLILFLKNISWRNAIWYGVSAGILLNVNFFGLINLFSQAVLVLIFLVLLPKENRIDYFKKTAFSGIIALLFLLPNYLMLQKLLKLKGFWVRHPKPDSFGLIFDKFFGESQILMFIILPVFLFYFYKMIQNKEPQKLNYKSLINNKLLFSFVVLFVWFFVFFSFLMIKSYGTISYLLARYFISITPVLFLVLGTSFYLMKAKLVRYTILFSLVFMTLVNLVWVKKYYSTCQQTQFRALSRNVISKNKNQDKIYSEYKYWFDYYFNTFHSKTKIENIRFEKLTNKLMQDSTHLHSFWYIGLDKIPFKQKPETKKFIDRHYTVVDSCKYYQVWGKCFRVRE